VYVADGSQSRVHVGVVSNVEFQSVASGGAVKFRPTYWVKRKTDDGPVGGHCLEDEMFTNPSDAFASIANFFEVPA
jgi:hypothetical protein